MGHTLVVYSFHGLNSLLMPSDSTFPLTPHHQLFPVRQCYCMTTKHSRRLWTNCRSIPAQARIQSHGQLWVGLSRVGSADRIKLYPPCDRLPSGLDGTISRNIVYYEVFHYSDSLCATCHVYFRSVNTLHGYSVVSVHIRLHCTVLTCYSCYIPTVLQ